MTTINQNFEMYAGDTKNLVVAVIVEDGTPADLSGATIRWVAKKFLSDAASAISKATGSGIEASSVVPGQFTVNLLPADTESLYGRYYHEAQITDADNNVSVVLSGKMTIMRSGI